VDEGEGDICPPPFFEASLPPLPDRKENSLPRVLKTFLLSSGGGPPYRKYRMIFLFRCFARRGERDSVCSSPSLKAPVPFSPLYSAEAESHATPGVQIEEDSNSWL